MAKRSFRPEDAFRLRTASDPDLSPDGRRVAFAVAAPDQEEDRLRSSIWVAALDGSSEPRPFTEGPGDKSARWSPDGRWLAYISTTDGRPDGAHVRLAPLDGGMPARVGDLPGPMCWTGDRELLMLVNDRGSVTLHRARLGDRRSREVVGGDLIIDGLAARSGRRAVAFTAAWPDRPSELIVTTTGGAEPGPLTRLNDDFLADVELAGVGRSTIARPDGTEVEYFTLLPPGRAPEQLPLHVDIHGGPHASWPSGRSLAFHQAIAAWEGDLRVPIGQGEELYTGLRLLGKKAELVRYPGGFHIQRTPSQAVDYIRRILDWDEQHDARPKKRTRH